MTRRPGLDESVGFWLGIAYRKVSNLLLQRIKAFDMTPEQWAVLYRIAERDGQIQKNIAKRAAKDRPTTTRILDSLESKGYIVRRPDERDRRSLLVDITDSGRDVVKQLAPIEHQVISEATEGLSPDEYAVLLRWLRTISDNTERHIETEQNQP